MSFEPISIVLFVPKSDTAFDPIETATLCGVRDVERIPARGVMCGRGEWSLFEDVQIGSIELASHHALLLQFLRSSFLALLGDADKKGVPLRDDPAYPVVQDFVAACVRISTEVGFIATRYNVAEGDWMEGHYLPVLACSAEELFGDVAVLYLSQRARQGLVPIPGTETLEQANGGVTVLWDSESLRWW